MFPREIALISLGRPICWGFQRVLLSGQDHLILSTAQLAEWQSNGRRVSLGTPYGLHGQHMVRQVYQWNGFSKG